MSGGPDAKSAEYHDKPNGHFVVSADIWESLLRDKDNTREGSRIAGQSGTYMGLPVYVGGCPWDCGIDRSAP